VLAGADGVDEADGVDGDGLDAEAEDAEAPAEDAVPTGDGRDVAVDGAAPARAAGGCPVGRRKATAWPAANSATAATAMSRAATVREPCAAAGRRPAWRRSA
jgi:hypothetical protein